MNYDELLLQSYEAYKEYWCNARGCLLEEYDEEEGFDGEYYESLEEFADNEFVYKGAMEEILDSSLFEFWLREND